MRWRRMWKILKLTAEMTFSPNRKTQANQLPTGTKIKDIISTTMPKITTLGGNEHLQPEIAMAQRLVSVVNESLKIANESQNADTKVSRLDFAKQTLQELKQIEKECDFITLEQLPQVEKSIAELENEFSQAKYREAVDGNNQGQALEKDGKVNEAVLVYERLLKEGVDTPFTYRRLAIIYSKRKQREEELRVLRAAIKNVPVENSSHYQWFAERLSKKS